MELLGNKWVLEMITVLLFIVLCGLTVKEFRSQRHSFSKRSYVYFTLLAVYLVLVWNITPTDLNVYVSSWISI